MKPLLAATKEKLLKISTTTIVTCLFKKGLKNPIIQDVVTLGKDDYNTVSEAF